MEQFSWGERPFVLGPDEREEVVRYWEEMPGSTTFLDALVAMSHGVPARPPCPGCVSWRVPAGTPGAELVHCTVCDGARHRMPLGAVHG